MKKLISISIAFLILISGMHLSIATHICGGEVVAVKWSFSGEKANCGMESPKQSCPEHNSIASNCCKNKLSVYSVDNNYYPSSFEIKNASKIIVQVYDIPLNTSFNSYTTLTSFSIFIRPTDSMLANDVSLSEICIFRI